MKLPIKKKYFDMLRSGDKNIEYRDAHITFVCEETGEEITKDIWNVKLIDDKKSVKRLKELYPGVFEDDVIIAFALYPYDSVLK